MIFTGSATALVTPFEPDGGIDYESFGNLIDWQIESGTSALVILGTTGEAATLLEEELKEVMVFAVARINKRVPVIFGTGSNNTLTAVKMTKFAQAVGADAALIVNPYYNKSSQEGIYRHYQAIHDQTDLPILLYNVPSRTGANIEPRTIARLKSFDRIVGIKQATSNLSEIVEVAMLIDDGFKLYSGNDDMIHSFLSLGASGVISVVSNIDPGKVAELCSSYFNNDHKRSLEIQFQLKPLVDALFSVTNPIPVKAALSSLGKINNHLRLPLIPLNDQEHRALDQVLLAYGLEV
ncbi:MULTISPECIES: 4-hydroxy-tetrahydrodipicolinate synthase [unclassified Fusibacter]|uniref:4-hydroxy-tetrahydrodipicolinate synthase n=1 Tax=unclassified Fusibacter TaxID=2624464 RepID=UPI0010102D7E|nr:MULTISPECIES: 4-hydroxy-tetrahydrodipicolinate synthase [unclassified Fusibacter]MCK8058692.1 4-hydroxy-tetrahydrodipicolinate synthase [Fusibacter sp. A2]NPE21766.1 4-hydroxy-tetrahydrodipicolinate synthase [Fusibacter sp. A1]RXV61340.1 4-hydroxy-tetrahydrodipicolinate synthase [Fusibacter sp. A1]